MASPSSLNQVSEKLQVVRTRTFSATLGHAREVIAQLSEDKFTGKLVVNFSQGGVQSVVVEDQERLPGSNGSQSSA